MNARRSLTLAGLALVAAGLPQAAPAQTLAETCQGKDATIVKDQGTVRGTAGDDVIVAGRDTFVNAREGDDTICTDGGQVAGGPGRDSLAMVGTDEGDHVRAFDVEVVDLAMGEGYDGVRLEWTGSTPPSGTADGGPPEAGDTIAVIGTDSVRVDLVRGQVRAGGQTLSVTGFQRALAAATNVSLRGDGQDNGFIADACRMTVTGGHGRDRLRISDYYRPSQTCEGRVVRRLLGGPGNDQLFGGPGDDILVGGPGRDSAKGRPGEDRCDAEVEKDCER